jgi:hypothetical protein
VEGSSAGSTGIFAIAVLPCGLLCKIFMAYADSLWFPCGIAASSHWIVDLASCAADTAALLLALGGGWWNRTDIA